MLPTPHLDFDLGDEVYVLSHHGHLLLPFRAQVLEIRVIYAFREAPPPTRPVGEDAHGEEKEAHPEAILVRIAGSEEDLLIPTCFVTKSAAGAISMAHDHNLGRVQSPDVQERERALEETP